MVQSLRSWRPWFQNRPEIQGRVVTPDGQEHYLDPADLGEYSDAEDGPYLYGDRKTLRGPLPAVEVGAVVEECVTVRDHTPEFPAGIIRSYTFGQKMPVRKSRLILEFPAAFPLEYVIHRMPDLKPAREETDGRLRLVFETGLLEPWEEDNALAPGNISRRPRVRFSTGRSWSEVAAAYALIAEKQLAASNLDKLVRKTIKKEKDRDTIIALVLENIQKTVRYTGVEFGESSFVPSRPDETLKRRFGDCKDKAILLIAMLRVAGIPAHIALLNTGPSSDLDPELPGLGRFDHAIVYVPGDPAIWIDPTHRYARAGQLPAGDQGRLALIASNTTTSLTRTPASTPSDNTLHEHREVIFSRLGSGRVIETAEVTGLFEIKYRNSFGDKSETALREQLEQYIKTEYISDHLGEFEIVAPHTLLEPMIVRLEAEEASRVSTSLTDASIALTIGSLIRELPYVLRPQKEVQQDEDPPAPRKHPVLIQMPHISEIQYHIQAPPGYALTSSPDSSTRNFGPAVMTQEYSVDESNTVTAVLRFNTVKPIYTAEEVHSTREALKTFYEEQMPTVNFHHVGEAHLEAGRILEAMEEFRKLVRQFPEEALYHSGIARAFLAAGLGNNAREEARRAVELSPDSPIAHRTLGLILAHDELGRKAVRGFDPVGAEAALRRAKELDPDDLISRGELAILMEFNADGERYARDAKLGEAIDEYKSLREDHDAEGLTINLMVSLFRSERFDEVRELWKDAPRDRMSDGIYLAGTAATKGTDDAIREASRIADQSDAYRQILSTASAFLVLVRRYPEAAALKFEGAKGASDSVEQLALADMISKIRRHETLKISRDTPEGLAQQFLKLITSDVETNLANLRELFTSDFLKTREGVLSQDQLDELQEYFAWTRRQNNLSVDLALDSVLALAEITIEGESDFGYRARVRMVSPDTSHVDTLVLYIVVDGDSLRCFAIQPGWAAVGKRVMDLVAAGELDQARRWLDWVADDSSQGQVVDVIASHPMEWLWRIGADADEDTIRLAAASLMIDCSFGDDPIATLKAGLNGDPDRNVRTGLNIALGAAGNYAEDFELQLEATLRLAGDHTRSAGATAMIVSSLIQLKRYEEADKILMERKNRFPGESSTLSIFADLARYTNDLTEHRKRLMELVVSGRAEFGDYNNLAWLDIVEDRVTEESVQHSQQAVTLSNYTDPGILHTLATIYAELGRVTEARDILLAILENRPKNVLESPDWYILGRIAEAYGAEDTALKAYRKVEPPEDEAGMAESTFRIAARRLKQIEERDR